MKPEQLRVLLLDLLAEIAPEADLSKLDPAVSFRDQIGVDSLDFLEFISSIEEKLGIIIGDDGYLRLSSLDGCMNYLAPLAEGKTKALDRVTVSEIKEDLSPLLESYPFFLLSKERAEEAIGSLRLIKLELGEEVVLSGGQTRDYLYVVRGSVRVSTEMKRDLIIDTAISRSAPVDIPAAPGSVKVRAVERAVLGRGAGATLDYLLTWDMLTSESTKARDVALTRLSSVRRSLAFRRLPLECVEDAFRRMRRASVKSGTEVVRQGEHGDAFYVIESGHAEVWKTGLHDTEPKRIAEFGPGDTFGEDALLLRGRRNATVRMITDGTLLVLTKHDFDELMREPMVEQVDCRIAKVLLDSGYVALDVRYTEEYDESHIPGAVLLPLCELRGRVGELSRAGKYLVYCRHGGRGAVATFLLRQRNYEAVNLDGGLGEWPYELAKGAAST